MFKVADKASHRLLFPEPQCLPQLVLRCQLQSQTSVDSYLDLVLPICSSCDWGSGFNAHPGSPHLQQAAAPWLGAPGLHSARPHVVIVLLVFPVAGEVLLLL